MIPSFAFPHFQTHTIIPSLSRIFQRQNMLLPCHEIFVRILIEKFLKTIQTSQEYPHNQEWRIQGILLYPISQVLSQLVLQYTIQDLFHCLSHIISPVSPPPYYSVHLSQSHTVIHSRLIFDPHKSSRYHQWIKCSLNRYLRKNVLSARALLGST